MAHFLQTLKHKALPLILASMVAGSAAADTITFEDLYAGYDMAEVLDPAYAGLDWTGDLMYLTNTLILGRGMEYGTLGNIGLVAIDGNLSFSRAVAFNFNSAYITSGWNLDQNVTVQGWRGGALVYSRDLLSSYTGPNAFAFDFNNIDLVSVHGEGGIDGGSQQGTGLHLVFDNIEITEVPGDPGTNIPEPGSLLLLGLAAMLMAGYRRARHIFKR
jgi:hypothetical protein